MDDSQLEVLFTAANAARLQAYAPYSNFQVGAAILSEGGVTYSGCNVENAAYPVGTCAESGAISAMVAAGERNIFAIAIVGSEPTLCPPCGACRQRIAEFSTPKTLICLYSPKSGKFEKFSVEFMLPLGFDGTFLK